MRNRRVRWLKRVFRASRLAAGIPDESPSKTVLRRLKKNWHAAKGLAKRQGR